MVEQNFSHTCGLRNDPDLDSYFMSPTFLSYLMLGKSTPCVIAASPAKWVLFIQFVLQGNQIVSVMGHYLKYSHSGGAWEAQCVQRLPSTPDHDSRALVSSPALGSLLLPLLVLSHSVKQKN